MNRLFVKSIFGCELFNGDFYPFNLLDFVIPDRSFVGVKKPWIV